MPVEVSLNTPLATALNAAIEPKLREAGWADSSDDSALAEYIVLMLVNGKTEEEIAAELSRDFLNLPPDDPTSLAFAKWLFEQIDLLNNQLNGGQAAGDATVGDAQNGGDAGEMDTDMAAGDVSELNAPTGPKSMRNGNMRGGREKRMMGHMSKAMDRTGDSVLHRTRGQSGINTHGRAPPTGPRGANFRGRGNQRMAANIQHGMNTAMGGPQGMMMNGQQGGGMDVYAILEQQNQMMMQLSQQLMNGNGGGRGGRGGRGQNGHHNNHRGRGGHQHNKQGGANQEGGAEGDDVNMGEQREPANPDEAICKYNLNCTNRECKFAHQSPAAPRGAHIDVNDPCSFGAACKNFKCVGRHPSPATKLAHQGEQDCKFFPNCQNPRCPFKHPSMPLCRNGADCTTEGCKFTHVKTKCKFNPCKNRNCAFQHDEGQQGGFKDKVWTAEGGDDHVSDRKFVGEAGDEELVKPEDQAAQDAEVIG